MALCGDNPICMYLASVHLKYNILSSSVLRNLMFFGEKRKRCYYSWCVYFAVHGGGGVGGYIHVQYFF